jgi:hypothetical protein
VEAAGIEPQASSAGNTAVRSQSGAESGAVCERVESSAPPAAIDAGLVAVVQAWPYLPEAIRAGILAIVRASG